MTTAYERPTPFRCYSDGAAAPVRAVIYAHRVGRNAPLRDVIDIRPAGLTAPQFRALLEKIEPAVQAAILELQS